MTFPALCYNCLKYQFVVDSFFLAIKIDAFCLYKSHKSEEIFTLGIMYRVYV